MKGSFCLPIMMRAFFQRGDAIKIQRIENSVACLAKFVDVAHEHICPWPLEFDIS